MLNNSLKAFFAHKKIIWLAVLASFTLSTFEYFSVGTPADLLNGEPLQNTSFVFLLTNLLNYGVFFWCLMALIQHSTSTLISVSRGSILFAFIKASFTFFLWLAAVLYATGSFFSSHEPGQTMTPVSGEPMISGFSIGLITLATTAVITHLYGIFIITFTGSIIRSQLPKIRVQNYPALAAKHLPFSAFYYAFKLPMLYLSLCFASFLKIAGFCLMSAGVPFVNFVIEPLALLTLLFSFYIAYLGYAAPQLQRTFINHR